MLYQNLQIFNLTDLAQPIDKELEWIEGFDVIYNSDSIDNDKVMLTLSMFQFCSKRI